MKRASKWAVVPVALAIAGTALAQDPEQAPATCKAQVVNALSRLAPAFAGKTRKIAAKQPGSIEAAIWGYAPPKYHDVSEGSLPTPKSGTPTCAAEMALVSNMFCIDKWEGTIATRAADGSETAWSPYQVSSRPFPTHFTAGGSARAQGLTRRDGGLRPRAISMTSCSRGR